MLWNFTCGGQSGCASTRSLGLFYPFLRFVTTAVEQAASGFPVREMRGHGQHARPSHSHFGSLTKEHGVHTETASHVTGMMQWSRWNATTNMYLKPNKMSFENFDFGLPGSLEKVGPFLFVTIAWWLFWWLNQHLGPWRPNPFFGLQNCLFVDLCFGCVFCLKPLFGWGTWETWADTLVPRHRTHALFHTHI